MGFQVGHYYTCRGRCSDPFPKSFGHVRRVLHVDQDGTAKTVSFLANEPYSLHHSRYGNWKEIPVEEVALACLAQ